MNCTVTRYDKALADLLWQEHTGLVLGIYRKCFHLLLDDGRVVTVFADEKRTMPMSLYTDISDLETFACLPLEEGQAASFQKNHLRIPDASFFCKLGGTEANLLRPSLPVPHGTDLLQEALLRFGKANGEGRWLRPWCDHVSRNARLPKKANLLDRMDMLMKAIDFGGDGIWTGLMNTVGLGIGLTPSGDDMICGMAAAAWLYWPETRKQPFLRTLSRFCQKLGWERTTRLSCQQLELTARGVLSDPVFQLGEALSVGQGELVDSATMDVIQYGSSSGTELCMGFLAGMDMAVRYWESEGKRYGNKELCHQKQIL